MGADVDDVPEGAVPFKCHPDGKQHARTRVCLKCGSLWHRSCLQREKGTITIDQIFVICCGEENLTSNSQDSDEDIIRELKQMIAGHKLEIAKLNMKPLEQTQNSGNESEENSSGGEDEEEQSCTGCRVGEAEKKIVELENKYLKGINNEIEDKNKLLQEKNNLLENQKGYVGERKSNNTYAEVFKLPPQNQAGRIQKTQKSYTLFIKPKQKQDSQNTKTDICQNFRLEEIKAGVKNVQCKSEGMVKIKCIDEKDKEKIGGEILRKLKDKYTVENERLWNPKIKIVGIGEE
ncbi:hypothetical protein QAD02_002472 [Eretmocerus hayati]|uniref:Uncharacterized protein n=1 Tax=Eretmocerus hayati TaxID=131215 RepID=A0ACC2NJ49_9HYME|nr:hypothetical protein QAD02_002472 [Eretmocerus hayati]